MQFKHPELLYALFLLLIPIIVHLFQLRKFQREDFTNVAFLKEATLQTRKSSQIKKWLILLTRMLLLAALVFAFAQPYTSKKSSFNTEKETIIYLDNSFSMQAKGNQGALLKRAVQDIITNVSEEENITLITNNQVFKNTTITAIKNDLLKLDYAATQLTSQAALLKSKTFFTKQNGTLKNLIFISDFQQDNSEFNIEPDSLTQIHLVKLEAVNKNNIAIDSAFISKTNANNLELSVSLKNSGAAIENLPMSLFNDDKLIAKTSVAIIKASETTFTLPTNAIINGKITIEDASLQFDNTLFFNINKASKINVLAINAADDVFLKRIYTDDEFNYTSTTEKQLNFNLIDKQHLIILNELEAVSTAMISALKLFTNQGGSLVVIPSENVQLNSYNQLLNNYGAQFTKHIPLEKRITTINYSHPLYNNGVFEKQVKNFQYPKVSSYYGVISNGASNALQLEDGKPFLTQLNHTYAFSAPINDANSSFKNSPLIVPTLFNMAKQSFKTPHLYFTLDEENTFDVETQMQQDAVLSLVKEDINLIPRQQYFNNKVVVQTSEEPSVAGIYTVMNKAEAIKNISYNYNRSESALNYRNLSDLKQVTVSDSVTKIFDTIKSDTKINALWKWFVIFALALLIIELLILKFFK
ncbi:BatA domain-containing protein [Tamlana sp. 2_MG-2023]|uniref:BatA domain-containing protein n=1 Tax=unclassified Tamlana TaxID=2614803 RepID=UPI0026E28876|nr:MULTISPECIES: BatA domain-containing protein [unclassified Tamlana]MDO6758931.1 BatA domain-containing protein [Tamlana sp. 2_MG-2023]MDO6789630.1 BatA domain-containing protein [Tamlana sp. 1_MG-2023]